MPLLLLFLGEWGKGGTFKLSKRELEGVGLLRRGHHLLTSVVREGEMGPGGCVGGPGLAGSGGRGRGSTRGGGTPSWT